MYHKKMNFGRIKKQIIEGDFDGGTLSSDDELLRGAQIHVSKIVLGLGSKLY